MKRRRSRPQPSPWLAIVAFGAACAPDRSFAPEGACFVSLDEEVYAHACQHGARGPFERVVAYQDAAAAGAPVSGAQRVFDVVLPGAADPDLRSYVRYRPTRDGQHAVFSGAAGRGIAVGLWAEGRPLPATLVEPVPDPDVCGGMFWVTGFTLTQGADYLLELGPTRATNMFLFIEHVATFGAEDWSAPCGT